MMKSVAILLLALLCLVQASHFRFGTLDWRIENPTKPNEVTFTLSIVMRASYFGTVTVGQSLYVNGVANEWSFGDGTYLSDILATVDQVQGDSFNAHFSVKHTYPVTAQPANYLVVWESNARLGGLMNNANSDWLVSTLVTLYTAVPNLNSPRSSSLPIVSAVQNQINDIDLLAADAEGAVTYSLSSPAEQGSSDQVQPPGFSVVSSSIVRWDTTGLATGLYNAQVKITDSHGAYVVLDFLLNLIQPSSHPAPYFINPTPAAGTTLQVNPGLAQTLAFQVVAKSDVTTDVISIVAGNLPGGVVLSAAVGKNPASITVTWVPTVLTPAGTFPFIFQASNGFGAISISFFVTVVAPSSPTATPMPPTATPMPPTNPPAICGDGVCSMTENCATCAKDCNQCPMVIYNRNSGMVVTATSFGIGATIHLTPYDQSTRPNQYQAWSGDMSDGRIKLWQHRDLILGAGPTAQKLAGTVRKITWDFKGAIANSTASPQNVHTFKMVPVANTMWSYIQNVKLDGFGTFTSASCLSAPYEKPTNAALKEVWGPNCKSGDYYVQHFRFWTYQCANGVKC